MRAVLGKRAARKSLLTTFTKAQIRHFPLLAEIAYVNVNELSTPVGLRVGGLFVAELVNYPIHMIRPMSEVSYPPRLANSSRSSPDSKMLSIAFMPGVSNADCLNTRS